MLVKLKDYKIAKKYKTDSTEILKVIDLATRALIHFKYYTPVKKILSEMNDQKAILLAHLATADKLLNQGRNDEQT